MINIVKFYKKKDGIKLTDINLIKPNTDLSKLYLMDWDLELYGKPWNVYRLEDHCHCIGGRYGDNNIWCCPANEKPTYNNLVGFNGKAPAWGITFSDSNYLKHKWGDSTVEGSGGCYITRNGKNFYHVSGRDVDYCLAKAQYFLVQLQEHAINFHSRKWKKELINRKVYYKNSPAIITMVFEEDGHFFIEPDKKLIQIFPREEFFHGNEEDECGWYEEWKDGIKCDYLDQNINWFRK